jgi:heptosyltransferase-2
MRGRILVVRGGAIGDFILTLPAITALREQFPTAHLEVLGYPHIIQLALAAGIVDRAQPIEARSLAGFFARNGELAQELVDYFSEFDLIISYLYDPDEIFQTNVRRCSIGQFIAGPHRPDENSKTHASKVYLRPLERLAIFEANPVPRLRLSPYPTILDQIALHPGSGSEEKNWPEAKWAGLLQHLLRNTSSRLLLLGGEAEGDRLVRLLRVVAPDPERVQVAQNLPLVELARLMQKCAAFIGHDSGISHLAAALGLPGIILWGATQEEIWRPPTDRVILLRHPAGLAQLPVSTVVESLPQLVLQYPLPPSSGTIGGEKIVP